MSGHVPVRLAAALASACTAALLTGCGGGGGGGGIAVTPTPTVTTPVTPPAPAPPPPPPEPPPPGPSATSTEYLRNYGLAAMHTDAAYAAGASGSGITVAVLDSGVDHTQVDLAANVSSASIDAVATRNAPDGEDKHGTYVAGVIASSFNGLGTIGVAYNSTILSVRTDKLGSCASASPDDKDSGCRFGTAELARGIDYAIANGARIINLSLGGPDPLGSTFEAALSRAVAAGLVVTASSGNDALADPEWPARYVIDPRFAGSVMAVGATDQNNAMAAYSNKAGIAAAGYLVAPGDKVISSCDGTSCFRLSGTSFAAPHAAGALALLLQAFPNLSGRAAVDLLLRTADDLGDPGVDAVYGHGLLNLQRAFAPVGTLSTASATGGVMQISGPSGSSLSGSFGGAVADAPNLKTVGYDSYQRLFAIDLAGVAGAQPRTSLQGAFGEPTRATAVAFSPARGTRFELTASRPSFEPPGPPDRLGLRPDSMDAVEARVRVSAGRLSFEAYSGGKGAPSAVMSAGRDSFTALASARQAVRAGVDVAGLTFSGEMGGGTTYARYGVPDLKPSSYALASVSGRRGRFAGAVSYGSLEEPEGPFGSLLPHTSGLAMPARTSFGSARVGWTGERVALTAEGGLGRTRADGVWLSLNPGALSSTWRLSATTICARPGCAVVTAELAQPVRLEQGSFLARLADVPTGYYDPLSFSTRTFSAAPDGRELDLKLGLARDLGQLGRVQLLGVGILQEQNRAAAPLNLGLLAHWSAPF